MTAPQYMQVLMRGQEIGRGFPSAAAGPGGPTPQLMGLHHLSGTARALAQARTRARTRPMSQQTAQRLIDREIETSLDNAQ